MKRLPIIVCCMFLVPWLSAGCNRSWFAMEDIHGELLKKLETEKTVAVDWGSEQKKYSSLQTSQQEAFQDSFRGKKVRTLLRVKEFKTADMTLFQRAFAKFTYQEKERFNFEKLMVVTGNGPGYGGIETSFVVFLPNQYLFDFNKGQEIIVEGLVDSVSFTFYNCHIALYPAALISN